MSPEALSEIDRSLLRLLQEDSTRTLEALAREVGLSSSAVQRRVQALREQKVLIGEVALVNAKAVGRGLTLLVELELERDRPELLPDLHAFIARTPDIQEAWHITGRGDYTLVIVTASVEDFDALMGRLMRDNRNVRKFTTSVALKTIKRTLAVPV